MARDLTYWSVPEVLEATKGRLIAGDDQSQFTNVSTDSRTLTTGALFVAIEGPNFDGHAFVPDALNKGALGVVISESHGADVARAKDRRGCWIVVADTLRALGDLAAYRRRQFKASVVAITGTNGKTTTKEMTAGVLSRRFTVMKTAGNLNNLVGVPLTLFGLRAAHEWVVLELGMNHPGEIRRLTEICGPQVGLITNIGAGHLEGLKDIDGVMRAKGELLETMSQDGVAVINGDDPRACRLAERYGGRVVTFGMQKSADVWAASMEQTALTNAFDLCRPGESVRVNLPIAGAGAVYSALAAAAVAQGLGMALDEVRKGLEAVSPLPGRMEILSLAGQVHVINDTYNANPASMRLAIDTLRRVSKGGRTLCVLGDMRELGAHAREAHEELGAYAARAGVSGLYATGEFASLVKEGAVAAGMDESHVFIGSREEIAAALEAGLKPGDWILIKGSRLMGMEAVTERLKKK